MNRLSFPCLIFALLVAGSAYAQAAEPGADRYDAAIAEAVAEFGAGRWTEARALFGEAHRLNPNARTLRGLGMAAFELRNYVEARQMLSQALASQVNPLTAELRSKTDVLLQRTNAFVGLFTLETPAGTMAAVDGAPAQFDSDGRMVINGGKHTVEVVLPDGEKQSRQVDVRGGEVGTITFEAQAAAPTAPTDEAAQPLPPTPAMTAQASVDSDSSIMPWVLIAGGGALVVASVVTGIVALNAQSTLKADCDNNLVCTKDPSSTKDRANTMKVVTDVLWITGAVAAGVGITWLILDGGDDEAQASGPSLELAAGPTSLLLQGQF